MTETGIIFCAVGFAIAMAILAMLNPSRGESEGETGYVLQDEDKES